MHYSFLEPQSAVCQGAVELALNPGGIVSRIATILFRVKSCRNFEDGSDHPDVTGERSKTGMRAEAVSLQDEF
jgi:hypothetical protein